MAAADDLDRDAARALNTGRETLGVTLRLVQKQLQKVFVVFALGLILGIYAMREVVWPALERDLLDAQAEVIAQTPFDVILLQVKVGMIVGVLLSLVALLYLSRDTLRERGVIQNVPVSRWKAVVVAGMAAALFVGGIAYAYELFFPIMFSFLANNATKSGFAPTYSIVMWTQFILVLGISFGLAAQLPLAMTALSYSGIVPYETFRDKWKYAVVIMFTFGAVFSPPDPFTQIMWAAPLVLLYAISLYLSKIVVTAKRGRDDIELRATLARHWNLVAGTVVVAFGAVYAFFRYGGGRAVNDRVLPALPASVRPAPFPPIERALGLSRPAAIAVVAAVGALVVAVALLAYLLYRSIEAAAARQAARQTGPGSAAGQDADPAAIDVGALDAEGVRAAPPEAFAELSEGEALSLAQQAVDDDQPRKARAILDRYDEAEEAAAAREDGETDDAAAEGQSAADESSTVMGTTAGMVDAFTAEETTEDDIGGYLYDIRFIVDSLRSRIFRIVAWFMLVMAGTFAWLYTGGIGDIRADFVSRMPPSVPAEEVAIITLHPVEALVFDVKMSVVVAVLAVAPVLLYYAWPALRERGFVRGSSGSIRLWGVAMVLGLAAGTAVGYLYVAPHIISWLAYDALDAGMLIRYRVNNFFWLVFLTTAGVGILFDIPISMVLFHLRGMISYRSFRKRWRGVAILAFALAGLLTPDSVYTMFVVAVPVLIAYAVGLAILWAVTLGGRRGGRPAGEAAAD